MLPSMPARARPIALAFAVHGMIIGSYFPRLAEIQLGIGLTEREFGLSLVGAPLGAFTAFLFLSRFVEKIGTRRVLMFGLPVWSAFHITASLAWNAPSLFMLLSLAGMAFAFANTAINVEADRMENHLGQRVMNRCHAVWSVGFLASSLAATAITAAGLAPAWHFTIVAAATAAAMALIGMAMEAAPPRPHARTRAASRFVLPTRSTAMLFAFVLAGVWLDAGSRQWSVIYLRDTFGAVDWVATLTLPAMMVAQIGIRLFTDALIERAGIVRLARVLMATALAGLVLVVLSVSIPVSLLGFLMIGLGVGPTMPMTLSAAAGLGDRPSSENVASVSLQQTMLMFMTPPLMGLVAGAFGIAAAFAVILPFPLLSIWLAKSLERGAAVPLPAAGPPTP
jgi:MFS family permease